MNCPQCGKQMSWPHEVQLCNDCFKELDPTPPLVGKPVTLIWHQDWDRIVEKLFGKPYCFQQQGDMMGQDSIWTFTVPENFDNWDMEAIDRSIQLWLTAEIPRTELIPAVQDGKVIKIEQSRREWPVSKHTEELWWQRENYPDFDVVMCKVAQAGLIAPGDYALHIWW